MGYFESATDLGIFTTILHEKGIEWWENSTHYNKMETYYRYLELQAKNDEKISEERIKQMGDEMIEMDLIRIKNITPDKYISKDYLPTNPLDSYNYAKSSLKNIKKYKDGELTIQQYMATRENTKYYLSMKIKGIISAVTTNKRKNKSKNLVVDVSNSSRIYYKDSELIFPPMFITKTIMGVDLQFPSFNYIVKQVKSMMDEYKNSPEYKTDCNKSAIYFFKVTGKEDEEVFLTSAKILIMDITGKFVTKEFFDKQIDYAIEVLFNSFSDYGFTESFISVTTNVVNFFTFGCNSILNWNLPKTDPIIILKDFNLFVAPDLDEDCKLQCLKYLGLKNKYDPAKSLKEVIKCNTYIPKFLYLDNIKRMSDLIQVEKENYSIKILEFNGHCGVIIPKKEVFDKTRYQRQITMKEDNKESIDIFFDIEAYEDKPDEKKISRQLPYLICWCEGNGKIENIHGDMCHKKFIEVLRERYSTKKIYLYAWFGSGYDFHHIYTHLVDYKDIITQQTVMRNTLFLNCIIKYTDGLDIELRDPYLFLLCSLQNAAKAFGTTLKTSFPHNLIKNMDDIYSIYSDWYKIGEKVVVNHVKFNKIYIEIIEEKIPTNEPPRRIIDYAIEYCSNDVRAQQEIWYKFNDVIKNFTGSRIPRQMFTLSQLSMNILMENLPKKVKLVIPNKQEYDYLKKAIYGGRVFAKNGHYKEDILYADVISLYPSTMLLLDHPYGTPYRTNKINWDKLGVYTVILRSKGKPSNYMNFVPHREDKLCWNWKDKISGVYSTYDLIIAKKEGYEIECIEGMEYPKKGKIFKDYIEKMYKFKELHSNCNCPKQPCPLRWVAKIALNGGGFGKFIQKEIAKEVYIVERDIVASLYGHLLYKSYLTTGSKEIVGAPLVTQLEDSNYDKLELEKPESSRKVNYCTANGIMILSGSRLRLYEMCEKLGKPEMLYSDTDSIFIKKSNVDINEFNKLCGNEIGKLDNTIKNSSDNIIKEMIVLGPKSYAYKYNTNNGIKTEIKAKGIPNKYLNWDIYNHIISDVNNSITVIYTIINKKLSGIKTRTIEKRMRQT